MSGLGRYRALAVVLASDLSEPARRAEVGRFVTPAVILGVRPDRACEIPTMC